MGRGTSVDSVILGRRSDPDEVKLSGIVEGQVVAVTAAGMTFKISDWDGGKYIFGPAPWPKDRQIQFVSDAGTLNIGGTPYPHTHDGTAKETQPVAGDRCLICFTDNGPWVIGWWPKS